MKNRKNRALAALILSFVLGSYNGQIALWREGQAQPLRVFPYQVAALPEKDQAALEKGIPLGSEEELIRLIEDYLS